MKLGKIIKEIAAKAIPFGDVVKNIYSENETPSGKWDKSTTWQVVALELGKLVIYALALHYLDIDLREG